MSNTTFDRSVLGFEAAKLLETLLVHAGVDGRAQLSMTALLKASGLTQGALIRARTELGQHDLLRVEPGFSANGLRGANVYALNVAALEPASSRIPRGESGQNQTTGASITPPPGASEIREDSSRGKQVRKGFLARLLRRSRTS